MRKELTGPMRKRIFVMGQSAPAERWLSDSKLGRFGKQNITGKCKKHLVNAASRLS